ncbi:hypothetical protein JTE90_023188 [Oedothorax gibbosus]|uniref:Metalloendopeptidase n=1 Tax=Oedothorax gibbosus TaxID=931172 RepID=A0AAV6UGK4_9ARAC|nr:hypothetical protein JTE90_023188 [Oedothorax gibbosus]
MKNDFLHYTIRIPEGIVYCNLSIHGRTLNPNPTTGWRCIRPDLPPVAGNPLFSSSSPSLVRCLFSPRRGCPMRGRRVAWGALLPPLLMLLLKVGETGGRMGQGSSFPHLVSGDADMDPGKGEIFEGDIIIDRSPHTNFTFIHDFKKIHIPRRRRKGGRRRHSRRRTDRAATARADRLWPHAVIPYEIEANFSGEHRALFKQAMRYWENETCVQFVERTPAQHPDYIVFTERACGCCSFVGRRGNGAQAISIGKNCDKFGIVVHELGHVVGFWHEHTRPDRDKHVQIISRNIVAGQEYNFNKLTEEEVNSLGLQYDYESIMHYARNTFSRSTALDTILPTRGREVVEIGQRVRLSPGDVAQTNILYKCPACGRTYQEPSGFLASPGFDSSSFSGQLSQHCEWRISATQGERISFEVTAVDIDADCATGYLEIRDGYWNKSPLLGRFCGNRVSGERFVSIGHRMLVIYHTLPSAIFYKGFQAKYEALCGGSLEQAYGTIQSPNYPDEYRANKECIWKITVAPGSQVALTFQAFEVEYHDNCGYDFVEVRDGLELHSGFLARLCGYKVPEEVRSTSNHMLVRFFSDSSVLKMGFAATFVTEVDECAGESHGCEQRCVNTIGGYRCECAIGFELHSDGKRCEDACGGVLSAERGMITSPSFPDLYPSNKQCIWEIVAPPRFRITLNFTHFDLEGTNQECEYDSVDVRSKVSPEEEWKKQGTFCGSRLPPTLTSEGSQLRIEFVSDNSVQKSGFAALYFTDQDECATANGGCLQICKNTVGSYQCSCHNGFVLHPNGHDCKEGSCVHHVLSTDGVVSSPNFPDHYPSRKECTWTFDTTPGHRIKLVFDSFELEPHQECAYDHVALYDGDSSDSPLLGRFCGSKVPHPILSTAHTMLVAFRSDPSVQRNGFRAHHTTVCGGRLSASREPSLLYSHAKFGDQNYGAREDCNWIVTAPNSGRVRIRFQSFDLEPEQDCAYDFVQVMDGFETSPTLGKFCGNKIPPDMTSSGFRLLIRFQSDDSISGKGFSLVYSEVFF